MPDRICKTRKHQIQCRFSNFVLARWKTKRRFFRQQMRGSCSPNSTSTTRVPPMPVFISSIPRCSLTVLSRQSRCLDVFVIAKTWKFLSNEDDHGSLYPLSLILHPCLPLTSHGLTPHPLSLTPHFKKSLSEPGHLARIPAQFI